MKKTNKDFLEFWQNKHKNNISYKLASANVDLQLKCKCFFLNVNKIAVCLTFDKQTLLLCECTGMRESVSIVFVLKFQYVRFVYIISIRA